MCISSTASRDTWTGRQEVTQVPFVVGPKVRGLWSAANLEVPVNDPVRFEVVVVLSEGVDELFSHLGSSKGQSQDPSGSLRPQSGPVQVPEVNVRNRQGPCRRRLKRTFSQPE